MSSLYRVPRNDRIWNDPHTPVAELDEVSSAPTVVGADLHSVTWPGAGSPARSEGGQLAERGGDIGEGFGGDAAHVPRPQPAMDEAGGESVADAHAGRQKEGGVVLGVERQRIDPGGEDRRRWQTLQLLRRERRDGLAPEVALPRSTPPSAGVR